MSVHWVFAPPHLVSGINRYLDDFLHVRDRLLNR